MAIMAVNDTVRCSSCHNVAMEQIRLQSEATAISLAEPAHIQAHSSQGRVQNRETCRRIQFGASEIWRKTRVSVGLIYIKETAAKA